MDKMLTTKEVMDILKVSRTTLYRLVTSGQIRAVKVGGSVRFKESELSRFIDALGKDDE